MTDSITAQNVVESLYQPLGLIRTATKTINHFIDESGLQDHGDGNLNGFDAMNMAELVLQQLKKMEHTIGVLELHVRDTQKQSDDRVSDLALLKEVLDKLPPNDDTLGTLAGYLANVSSQRARQVQHDQGEYPTE